MTDMAALEERISRLEAVEEIKKLKARYWYLCDQKDVEGVRDCFMDGPVEISYDGPVGTVHHRDGLYQVFKDIGGKLEIVEIHHGGSPQVEILDADHAKATWALVYHLINTEFRTVHQAGGYYHDEYTRVDGEWKISKADFRVCSSLNFRWKDREIRFLSAGRELPEVK